MTSTYSALRPSEHKVGGRAWVVTGLLCIFMIINFADKAVLGLVAEPAMRELGLTPTQWGMIGSAFFSLFAISSIFVGALASRISAHTLIFAMVVVWSAAQLPVFLGGAFMTLLITRILLGAGEGPALSISLHAVQNYFPAEKRALPSNVVSMGASLGAVVAAPILSVVIANFGWRAAFGATALIGIIWGVIWLFVGVDGPFARVKKRRANIESPAEVNAAAVPHPNDPAADPEEKVPAAPSGTAKVASSTELLKMVPARHVFGSGMWIAAGVAGFCCFWGQAILTTWIPQYIGGVMGVSQASIGLVLALPWLFGAILLGGLGWLAQYLMNKGFTARLAVGATFGASLVVGGTAMVILPHLAGVPAFVALTIMGAFTVFPMAPTACSFAVNPSQRALILGTLTGIASIGGIISPIVAGRLLDAAGYVAGDPSTLPALVQGLTTTLMINGGLLIVAGLGAIAFLRPEKARDALQRKYAIQA